MKSKIFLLVMGLALSGIAHAAAYWDNSAGDNDFTNDLNWSGDAGPTTVAYVNMDGGDQPMLLTGQTETRPTKLYLGYGVGTTGEMTVSGGNLTCYDHLYVGYDGSGMFHMESGTVTTTRYDVLVGELVGSSGAVYMNGGTITAQRHFIVGNRADGYLELNDGTINVNQYDFKIADIAGSVGTVDMYDGTINVTRDVGIGGAGIGTLNMYGGTINAGGKITIPRLTGGTGTLNLYGGTINGKLWMRNVEFPDPSNSQLVNIFNDGKIVMADVSGTIAEAIQVYIDNGWVNGRVNWDSDLLITTVAAVPEPATLMILGLGSLVLIRPKR